MEANFHYGTLSQEVWESYASLWQHSIHPSAFQSPHFIRLLAQAQAENCVLFSVSRKEKLLGAAFFQKQNGVYLFLSDLKTDHNFFLIHNTCGKEAVEQIFELFFEKVKQEGWSLMLNNQPAWAAYREAFKKNMERSSLYKEEFPYSVCPVLEEDSPQSLAKHLSKSKSTRYKSNRLQKEQNAVFEVFRDEQGLDKWVEEFCESHGKRWEDTHTPSAYTRPEQQQFLKECLQAWIADNNLARFSIRIGNGKRIAFCIGLIEGPALIHHSHTYDGDYGKYSPGKVLLRFIGQWMEKQGLSKLDFGDGNESFKYRYANLELGLNRIFIAPAFNVSFILKAKMIKAVRQQPKLYDFYRNRFRPILLRFRN